MKNKIRTNHWGSVYQFQLPAQVIQDGKLVLTGSSLAVFLVLLMLARNKKPSKQKKHPGSGPETATIRVGYKTLMQKTGYSKNVTTSAIQELQEKSFIRIEDAQRKKRGEFATKSYTICEPETGTPLLLHRSGNVLLQNKVQYVTIPRCLVSEIDARWSLANMSSSETRVYVVLCWEANRKRSNQLVVKQAYMLRLLGMGRPTFRKALNRLEELRLIWVHEQDGEPQLEIELCDPYVGEPVHEQTGNSADDAANYYTSRGNGGSRRANFNAMKPDDVEKMVRSALSEDGRANRYGDELQIICPFPSHADTNPSCSINLVKHIFHCFGCHRKGTLRQLMKVITGQTDAEYTQLLAESTGLNIEFHEPDRNAQAIYSYLDRNGKLVKQKLRYRREDGKKDFRQRRPSKGGGWNWSVEGLPMLYNLHRIDAMPTPLVCICEGERDCDTVMSLDLMALTPLPDGRVVEWEVVATTSGGSDTWDDRLADALVGKRVVLLPDADEPGRKYAAAVKASLDKRNIEYREVTFDFLAEAGKGKDVSDFVNAGYSAEDLAERIGIDWVRAPGTVIESELPAQPMMEF